MEGVVKTFSYTQPLETPSSLWRIPVSQDRSKVFILGLYDEMGNPLSVPYEVFREDLHYLLDFGFTQLTGEVICGYVDSTPTNSGVNVTQNNCHSLDINPYKFTNVDTVYASSYKYKGQVELLRDGIYIPAPLLQPRYLDTGVWEFKFEELESGRII